MSAFKGAAAWRHASATWLTAGAVMVIMVVVLLGLTVFLLRRQDTGRHGALARQGTAAAAPHPAAVG